MKHTPEKLLILLEEELGQVVELKPLNTIEASSKDPFWTKFESFLSEGEALEPIVNNDMKPNTLEGEEKIKGDKKPKFSFDNKLGGSYKISNEVENIASHNYDYSPSVENINNVNAQEVLTGIQCEINYNKELTLDEAKELAVKNLAKDPLHYVKEGQFGVKGLGYTEQKVEENDGETYGGSGYSAKLKKGTEAYQIVKEGMYNQDPMGEEKQPEEPKKKKRPKKETIDSKLAEIGKQGDVVKLEAQISYLDEIIEEKSSRLSNIQEDENLSELIDKKKMKELQRAVKLLEKKKAGMEKMYEKMCGKSYQKEEIIDETQEENE